MTRRARTIRRRLLPLVPLVVGGMVIAVLAVTGGPSRAGEVVSVSTPVLAAARAGAVQGHLGAVVGLDRRVRPDVDGGNGAGKSCVAIGPPTGPDTFDDAADEKLIPASTTKLVTAYAALHAFGPDHTFKTEVRTDGSGRVWLVGGGDPLLAGPEWIADHPDRAATPLQALADKLEAAGVRVNDIVVDNTWFDSETWVQGWEDRYREDGTAPSVAAVAVDRSDTVFPTGAPRPPASGRNPDLAAGYTFARLLGSPDIPVERGTAPADARTVAEIESPPMRTIVHEMNTFSDNFVAEVLVRQVGRSTGDGSTAGGLARVSEILAENDLDPSTFVLHDGSGLHRGNRISCAAFIDLLQDVATDPALAEPFVKSLAVGGGDGTLEKRSLGGEILAKTGTLRDVSALVGYAVTPVGYVPFALIDNDVSASGTARSSQDRIAEDVALWPAP